MDVRQKCILWTVSELRCRLVFALVECESSPIAMNNAKCSTFFVDWAVIGDIVGFEARCGPKSIVP